MKKEEVTKRIIKMVSTFFVFFLLTAFVCTCSIMLFTTKLQDTLGREFTQEEITLAAKSTMFNVILISIGMAVIDYLRRKFTVERPVKLITEATEKMIKGDFNIQIKKNMKYADDNFNNIIECINKMALELSGIETLRTDFISNVSHELKTPLSIIQNYGTLLQTSNLNEEKRIEYSKVIIDASRRLSDMMTNILKLNRLENQQIFLNFTIFNLSEQVCEELLQYESVWDKKNIEIETNITEDIYVEADSELLSLVWSNLFSNAFKFTDNDGKVTITLTTDEKNAIVKISDTGCGMTAEVGSHIFEKFYQGDRSHATQGNGLGLALVKRVVDILGCEIAVESALNEGTTFTVKIRRVENEL